MKYEEYLTAKSKVAYIEESGFIIIHSLSGGFALRADILSKKMKGFGFCGDNTILVFSDIEEANSFVEGWNTATQFSKLSKKHK